MPRGYFLAITDENKYRVLRYLLGRKWVSMNKEQLDQLNNLSLHTDPTAMFQSIFDNLPADIRKLAYQAIKKQENRKHLGNGFKRKFSIEISASHKSMLDYIALRNIADQKTDDREKMVSLVESLIEREYAALRTK